MTFVALLICVAVQSKQRMLFVAELKKEWSVQHCFEHLAHLHVENFQQV